MHIQGWAGIALALAAGSIIGSVLVPMKYVRNWAWENTWLIIATTLLYGSSVALGSIEACAW